MTESGARLRRADWRFLLPRPPGGAFEHLVLLGGPRGLGQRLVEAGTASRVSTTTTKTDPADALVILADARVRLHDVAGCLTAGGVLYWEIERPPWLRLYAPQDGLPTSFEWPVYGRTGVYWVIPNFSEARRYLPLDVPAAIEWFFATRFVAGSLGRRLAELLVRGALRWGETAMAAVVPCYGVLATGEKHVFTPASILGDPSLPDSLRARDTRMALFTSGQDDGSRVIVLPIETAASQPALVVKLARLPEFAGHTRQEQATLTELRARLGPELMDTVPAPLGRLDSGGDTGFVETSVPGQMLAASVGRWGARAPRQIEDLRLAADWLTRFHERTMDRRVRWDAGEIERWIEQPLTRYQAGFGTAPDEIRLFQAVRRRAESLVGRQLPIVWQHNDFGPWHLYRSAGRLSVIDWEFGRADISERLGLPLCDLLYFLVHWNDLARRLRGSAAELRGFRRLYLHSSATDSRQLAARQAISDYMRRLGIHPDFFPILLIATWVERANERLQRRQTLGADAPGEGRDDRFVRQVEVLAQHAPVLFGS
jgi:hypothetical protein